MSVTTWQAQEPSLAIQPEQAPAQGVSTRIVGETLSMVGNNKVSVPEYNVMRADEKGLSPNTGSILSTAQNNGGFFTQNIGDDTTVEIPGFGRTSLKVAERLGYVQKTSTGTYEDSNQQDFSILDKASQEAPQADTFGPKTEQAYAEMIAPIPQEAYDSVMGMGAAFIGSSEEVSTEALVAKLAPRLANHMGIEPAKAHQMIDAGAAVWQAQADGFVRSLGANPEEFYAWAKKNDRNGLQQAVQQQLFARNVKAYGPLVKAYRNANPPSAEAIERRGYETKQQNGETLIKTADAGWVLASVARRMGVI